ncbi:hypothetical protein GA0115234_107630 [Streptomyces sp. DvalAA-43]|nr:hypothetical protein GA0115234_107630 [Streptomyces sp. DvalAA-43]
MQVVGLLRKYGPSTTTCLAERPGVNSGTASYHLRQIGAAGFVGEDTERSNARERWWRSVHRTIWFNDPEPTGREPEAAPAYEQSVAAIYTLRTQQTLNGLQTMPRVWRNTFDMGDWAHLLVLAALIGAARGPGDLAKEVTVPEAAERGRVPLERATGLSGVTERLAATVGLAAGGSLVALLDPLTGLAVNAGRFALGSVIVQLAFPRGTGHATEEAPSQTGETGPGYWRRFGEGFTLLRREPLLLTVIVMVGITNLLDAAFTSVLVPVWAREPGNGPTASA